MSQYSLEGTLHLYDVIFEVIRLITKVIALGIGNIDSYIIGTSEKSEMLGHMHFRRYPYLFAFG